MSSDAKSFGSSDAADISQSLMSVEDKHYYVVNERDNYDTASKSDMQSTAEKLIANEAEINAEPVPKAECSAAASSADTKGTEAEGDSKRIDKGFFLESAG